MRRRTPWIAAFALVVLLAVPGIAVAASSSSTDATSNGLDFTLPTAGKSGCTVCHEDPNLVRIRRGKLQSLYVNTAQLEKSAHADVACTSCHVDFAYKVPHKNAAEGNWRNIAKLSCKNCHKEEFADITASSHAPVTKQGEKRKVTASVQTTQIPLCGDCHGGHDIQPLEDNPEGQEALDQRGMQMCGRCHVDYAAKYDDYYHGAAYRRGASDAPACWDCHTAHGVLPSKDRRSTVNETRLPDTCEQCHDHVQDDASLAGGTDYVSYSELVHRRGEARADNAAYVLLDSVRSRLQEAVDSVRSWF